MRTLPDGPATKLDDLYLTLSVEPLRTPAELAIFYRGQLNKVRGDDTVARLSRKLQQSYESVPFKAFLMGHSGVGKSTELSRLLERVKDQHRGVRLNLAEELNPASFKIFDVLVLIMIRLTEEAQSVNAGLLQSLLSKDLLDQIQQWFADEARKRAQHRTITGEVEAGAGIKGGSLLEMLTGLFASAKGAIKYTDDRSSEIVDYPLKRLPDLVNLCDRLIRICDEVLDKTEGKKWLMIIEDLDKASISPEQLQDLFIQYGRVFHDLNVSLIFTIPVWLAYSPDSERLLFKPQMIHDTPVFDKDHKPHVEGRDALRDVLEARMSSSLCSEDQMTKLLVASGGNIRDLFTLVMEAADGAKLADSDNTQIREQDCLAAIQSIRREYRQKLGQSPYDANPISYEEKWKKLLAVYKGEKDSDIPDRTLYSLLRARAVQEFNGEGWFGVHPIVVDILKEQGHLNSEDQGGTE
jgi:hypothetical protein